MGTGESLGSNLWWTGIHARGNRIFSVSFLPLKPDNKHWPDEPYWLRTDFALLTFCLGKCLNRSTKRPSCLKTIAVTSPM